MEIINKFNRNVSMIIVKEIYDVHNKFCDMIAFSSEGFSLKSTIISVLIRELREKVDGERI
jgi:hypothetical protein